MSTIGAILECVAAIRPCTGLDERTPLFDLLDSLQLVELIGALEKKFSLVFPAENVAPEFFETPVAIARLINSQTAEAVTA